MQLLINIDVDDLERATRFYTSAFELTPGRRLGPEVIELLGGNAPIYLLAKAAGSRASPHSGQMRDYARHWTPLHLDWVVADVDAALARALAAGAILEQRQEHAWGRLALLADPFGHGFCLLQFIGRGYDEILSP
ncbi:VOC family protein [Pseudomonas sp. Gutcm_11s]|uniref:VOC family protein n=1 Tax=Pseudomonas sp. Gutcm_11s TaxID=3026088 RepID=UPI00236077E8|nr:VOC family protein [Pseudomonas sp. Gutcm_11s]MDD0841391.1 VOC family protein [Pseudomonas sp. Gutcm_11s]